MKKKLMVLFVFSALLFANSQQAAAQTLSISQVENAIQPEGKYAFSVNNLKHFGVAVKTGVELKNEHPKIQFEVIVAGPLLKDLIKGGEGVKFVEQAEQSGIRVVACKLAMDALEINKSQLPKYIEVTKNAAIYIFGLKELGFKVL